MAEQLGAGSNGLFWLLCKDPKADFADVSLASFRKGFSWLPGSREQGRDRVIIPEQPGISATLWKTGEGVRVTDSSSFCGPGKRVLGDIFLSIKGRIQVCKACDCTLKEIHAKIGGKKKRHSKHIFYLK